MDADRDIDDVIEDISNIIMAEPSCAAISARAFVNSADKNVNSGDSVREILSPEDKAWGEQNGKYSYSRHSYNL